MTIQIDVTKARAIAHDKRREVRAQAFEPLDALIAKQIPGVKVEDVETERQKIREQNAAIQEEIDAAKDAAALLEIVKGLRV